jgi:GTP 3',8-cyclase
MLDLYKRHINYLRISVTDRCNIRCRYCMPETEVPLLRLNEIITYEEIVEVIRIAVELGINKVRLTGGEPLMRKGICDLVAMISDIGGIRDLAMTTNGVLLEQYAPDLARAGLNRINISLDTLDPEKFKYITRGGELDDVLRGIESARDAGLKPIKINSVLSDLLDMKDRSDLEEFCQNQGLGLRFIHQMNLETGKFYPVEGGRGGQCNKCNRLRLTSNGLVKPCLFDSMGYDIREIGIRRAIKMAVENKPLHGTLNMTGEFYNIGG